MSITDLILGVTFLIIGIIGLWWYQKPGMVRAKSIKNNKKLAEYARADFYLLPIRPIYFKIFLACLSAFSIFTGLSLLGIIQK